MDAGLPGRALELLALAGDGLPGAAGRDHLVLSYRVALGTGDTAMQESLWLRAAAMNAPELSSVLLHHRGMHRRSAGLGGWENDLVASLGLGPQATFTVQGSCAEGDPSAQPGSCLGNCRALLHRGCGTSFTE